MAHKSSSQTSLLIEQGQAQLRLGNFGDAEQYFASALAQDEKNADAWASLAIVWSQQKRFTEAADAAQVALSLKPDHPAALHSLGLTKLQIQHYAEAATAFGKLYELKAEPVIAELAGNAHFLNRDYKSAALFYSKCHEAFPDNDKIQSKLGLSFFQNGDTNAAVSLYIDLVNRFPDNETYINNLVDMYRKFGHLAYSDMLRNAALILLRKEFLKHRYLSPSWSGLILLDPKLELLRNLAVNPDSISDLQQLAPALNDELLCLGLEKTPVVNPLLEILLSNIREYFLLHWQNAADWPQEALDFLAALAVQCWYNDFVFFEKPAELTALVELENHLKGKIESAHLDDATARQFALYGCYRPLYNLRKSVPDFSTAALKTLATLIKVQLTNPAEEAAIIPAIPHFTEVTDAVSVAVRQMYEKRPYPRWRSALRQKEVATPAAAPEINILVAGCGTGQEPAIYANVIATARITAVDLSLASIAYGKRMAIDLGFADRIDFQHGDLMDVGKIGRSYDFIASSGVLHHMKDPAKGLEAILQTLKPGGRMSISLYSAIARDIRLNPAADYIKAKGYTSSEADIRQFRRDILSLPENDPRRLCLGASDFFSLSECNDLLFHVQEHRFTFLTIRDMVERFGLELFDAYLTPTNRSQYLEMFPDPHAPYTFEKLNEFEVAHPDAFLEMYKIYLRRRSEPQPSVLDSLLRQGLL